MSIELHIERLVLDEALLGGERADSVRATIERELTRLLSRPGAVDALRDIGSVVSLPVRALPDAAHARDGLGERVARALHAGLGGDTGNAALADVHRTSISTGTAGDSRG